MKSTFRHILPLFFGVSALAFTACNEDFSDTRLELPEQNSDDPDNNNSSTGSETVSSRNEQYRPQIHYTPSYNWINDPNGMFYLDGVWHLYYQYNPYGNSWGNMSWGHATSSDLIHWTEQPVAMERSAWGDIFSGSAIVDKNNVAGFGANAVIAFYTGSDEYQQQCMAYSTDGGMTFTQYEGNPVIPNNSLPDFRDPKVFYHTESGKYIMCLAMGWDHAVQIWGSTNLKSWNFLSEFRIDNGICNQGQWECPDLVKLPYKGGEKWVMIVSNNPGGPVTGSGTEYFIGSFDGTNFTPDALDYPLWLDYGADNYAGVTWSNAPDNRTVMIGWMNNWNYCGDVPCSPWRSAMTLPRELSLVEIDGNPHLSTKVVKELDNIAGEWTASNDGVFTGGSAYEAKVKVSLGEKTTLSVGNGVGEHVTIEVNPAAGKIIASRTVASGATDFNAGFAMPSMAAPFYCNDDEIELLIYIDHSSVEVINSDGTTAITLLAYPATPYDRIIGGDGAIEYRVLKSIW